jgi:hypothetical protein
MPTNANQCQPMPTNANQCQPMPTNANQCQPMPFNANQCHSFVATGDNLGANVLHLAPCCD